MQELKIMKPIFIIAMFLTVFSASAYAGVTIMDEEKPDLTGAFKPITKPEPPPVQKWTLEAGETIGHELQKWGDKAGWKVVWGMQKDWTVPASTVFEGEFSKVAGAVIQTLAANGALIHAQFYEGNNTMVITGASE